jgi:hypothetical protein
MTKILLFFVITILYTNGVIAQNWVPDVDIWNTNGTINTFEIDSAHNVVYAAGKFSMVGPNIPNGAIIDTNGNTNLNPDPISKGVYYSFPTQDGGFIILGEFQNIGETERSHIAHIDSSGRVTEFLRENGLSNSPSHAHLKDSILYISGIGSMGKAVPFNAVYEENEIEPDYFQPSANNTVHIILPLPNGGRIVGGEFTAYGDSLRTGIVEINSSNEITAWNPEINGAIHTMLLSNDTLFVGGDFTEIDGVYRRNLAAFSTNSGLLLNWSPEASSFVYDMELYGNNLIIAGYFDSINSLPRRALASVDRNSGVLNSWNPNPFWSINSICRKNNLLYVGGDFTSISGQSRNNLACFNLDNFSLTNWNHSTNNVVFSIDVNDNSLFIGGQFTSIDGQNRKYFGSINTNSNLLTSLEYNFGGIVKTVKLVDDYLFISGVFYEVNSTYFSNIIRVNITSGLIDSWNPSISSVTAGLANISAISMQGNQIYLGGNFKRFGGNRVNGIATININTGQASNFNISALGWFKMTSNDSLLIMAGGNMLIDGQLRSSVGIYNLNTGQLLPFNPDCNNSINVVRLNGDTLLIGGSFTSVDSNPREHMAAFLISSGQLLNWSPSTNHIVNSMEILGDSLFIGGHFSLINNQQNYGFGCVSLSNSTNYQLPANSVNGIVKNLFREGNDLMICGWFDTILGVQRNNFAILNLSNNEIKQFEPNPDGGVMCSSFNGSKYFIGGQFSIIGTKKRHNIAAFDMTTGIATNWQPSLNEDISKIIAIEDKVLLCGYELNVDGVNQNSYAELSRFDGSLFPVNLQIDGYVKDMLIKDSMLYLAGNFNLVLGNARKRIASINRNNYSLGNLSIPFHDFTIPTKILISNDTLFMNQTFLNASSTRNLALINLTTDQIINMIPYHGDMLTFEKYNQKLIISGDIDWFDNQICSHLFFYDLVNQQVENNISTQFLSQIQLFVYHDKLYSYGDFTTYSNTELNGIAEQSLNNFAISNFNPSNNYASIKCLKRIESNMFISTGYLPMSFYSSKSRGFIKMKKCNLPEFGQILPVNNVCLGDSVELELSFGVLNEATDWVWYEYEYSDNPIGFGTSIYVHPTETTKYFVRGEGGCVYNLPGSKIVVRMDEEAPSVVNCPSNQIIQYSSNNCEAIASWIPPTSLDNCPGLISVFESHQPGQVFPQGLTQVNYVFMDTNNNSSVCSFEIEVISDIIISGVVENVDCFGASNGSIITSITGGNNAVFDNWNDGEYFTENIFNLDAGVYYAVIVDADNCRDTAYFTISQPSPLNTNTINTGAVMVSTNTTPSVQYAWVDCNNLFAVIPGQTAQAFNITQNGSYAVQITQNGCANIGECYEISDVGLSQLFESTLVLSPNPTSDFLTIIGNTSGATIDVKNLEGKVVMSEVAESNETQLNMSFLKAGVYIVEVNSETLNFSAKVIKL